MLKRTVVAALMLAIGLLSATPSQAAVTNPSFEVALTGWTTLTAGGCNFASVLGGAGLYPAATDGVDIAGYQGCAPGVAGLMYQDVALPAGFTYTIEVSAGYSTSGSTLATDFFRIDVTDTTAGTLGLGTPGTNTLVTPSLNAGVLQTLFTRDSTQGNFAMADTAAFNITPLAGQTVRIRAFANTNSAPNIAALDNIRLVATPVAQTPTMSEWGMIVFMLLAGGMSVYFLKRQQGGAAA
jgi:hypothetical protein